MKELVFWHNPRCAKSRSALKLLEDAGHSVSVRRYLEDIPSLEELKSLQAILGLPAIEMMRPREKAFKEARLSKSDPDDALLAAMAAHPILIERPVAIVGTRAVIGRPPERVLEIV
ncbi:MAG: arsenate reductase (glutaredoxin) [Dinoroseobacter sp.]|nr:arsenate reductase (glutaredoxin) [Dinoroseobacter sp.]MDJ0993709.1 arsenate reductase (glutaredoxin) [Dinoroseobacter sp.]